MILDKVQLQGMKMSELRRLNSEMGGVVSLPSETKEQLINRMMFESSKQPEGDEQVKPTELPKSYQCTIDEVITAVNPYILRGMKVYYDKDSDNWLFRIQIKSAKIRDTNTGEIRVTEQWRDDSGTLRQPLSVIKRCAAVLMQGAPSPAQLDRPVDPSKAYVAVA